MVSQRQKNPFVFPPVTTEKGLEVSPLEVRARNVEETIGQVVGCSRDTQMSSLKTEV